MSKVSDAVKASGMESSTMYLSQRGARFWDRTDVPIKVSREFRDHPITDAMMIAPGQQRGARRRTNGRDVNILALDWSIPLSCARSSAASWPAASPFSTTSSCLNNRLSRDADHACSPAGTTFSSVPGCRRLGCRRSNVFDFVKKTFYSEWARLPLAA